MKQIQKDRLDIVGKIMALFALVLSLWNFFSPAVRSVRLNVLPEHQIQLVQEEKTLAFNLLVVITASGPTTKWETVKIEEAKLKVPDGRIIKFGCRAYLAEEGRGQRNQSRNIPVALQGGDSQVLTIAFQSTDLEKWSLGTYEAIITATTGSGKNLQITNLKFTLIQKDLDIVAKPNSIYMKPLD